MKVLFTQSLFFAFQAKQNDFMMQGAYCDPAKVKAKRKQIEKKTLYSLVSRNKQKYTL